MKMRQPDRALVLTGLSTLEFERRRERPLRTDLSPKAVSPLPAPTLPVGFAPHSGRPSCFGDAPKAVIAGRLETAQFGHASVSSPMRILQKWQRQDGLKG